MIQEEYSMNTTSRIKYSELVDIPKLQALMESFSQVIGIANAVIDVEGTVIVSASWQTACTDFHRVTQGSLEWSTEHFDFIRGLSQFLSPHLATTE